MFENPVLRKTLNYRFARRIDDGELQDVFDGQHFRTLCKKPVSWQGQPISPPTKYFAGATDIALGLSTDGIPLHNRTGLDAWPIVLTVYSLRPEIRYKQEFQICCGLVPGQQVIPLSSLFTDVRLCASRNEA